jgi:dienelactone hydrolase
MMRTRVSYVDEQQPLDGYLAAPDSARNLPGVLVVPSWLNVNESICRRADRLAELGYAVFVADLFGAGVRPVPPQSPMTVVGPFLDDRFRFRRRLWAGLRALQQRPECSAGCIAAIGYCIGGCGVLELARAAAPLRGVVSLHGILTTPMTAQPKTVVPKILVLHGDADPVVPPESVIAFQEEMRPAGGSVMRRQLASLLALVCATLVHAQSQTTLQPKEGDFVLHHFHFRSGETSGADRSQANRTGERASHSQSRRDGF